MKSLSLLFDHPGMSLDQLEVDTETITIETYVEASEAACMTSSGAGPTLLL